MKTDKTASLFEKKIESAFSFLVITFIYKVEYFHFSLQEISRAMAGAGNRVLSGTDRALDLLRSLPRLSLGNMKSNPKAYKQVYVALKRK